MLRAIADENDLSKTTLQHIKAVLSAIFTHAKNEGAFDGANLVQGTRVPKDQLFEQADILTIHLVLSSRTRGLVGAAELEGMKPTAWLINASRGPIVEGQTLISALKNKRIAGCLVAYDLKRRTRCPTAYRPCCFGI